MSSMSLRAAPWTKAMKTNLLIGAAMLVGLTVLFFAMGPILSVASIFLSVVYVAELFWKPK